MAVNAGSARLVFQGAEGETPKVRYERGSLNLKVSEVNRFFGRMFGKGTRDDYNSQVYSAAIAAKRLTRGASESNQAKYFDRIEKAGCLDENVAKTILLQREGMLTEQTAGALWGKITTPSLKAEALKQTDFLIPAEKINAYVNTGPNPILHYFNKDDKLAGMKNGARISDALVAYVNDKGDGEIAIPHLVMLVKIVCAFNKAGQIQTEVFKGMIRKIQNNTHTDAEDEKRNALLLDMLRNGGVWKHAIGILYEKEHLWGSYGLLKLLMKNPDKMSKEMQIAVATMIRDGLLYAKQDAERITLEYAFELDKIFTGPDLHNKKICVEAKQLLFEAYRHLGFNLGTGHLRH